MATVLSSSETIDMGFADVAIEAAFSKAVGDVTLNAMRRVSMAITGQLIGDTPINTGKAKSNWIVSIDSPYTGEIGSHVPGEKGSTKEAVESKAMQAARTVIYSFDPRKDKVIYITNNVDYVQKLNAGTSKQAPAGFIEAAIQAGSLAGRGVKVTS